MILIWILHSNDWFVLKKKKMNSFKCMNLSFLLGRILFDWVLLFPFVTDEMMVDLILRHVHFNE